MTLPSLRAPLALAALLPALLLALLLPATPTHAQLSHYQQLPTSDPRPGPVGGVALGALGALGGPNAGGDPRFPYVLRCYRRDAHLGACLTRAANVFARRLRRGAPELGYPQAEPIVIDEVTIRLGDGADGYRAMFRDITAHGVSNLTITNVRSDLETLQFQLSFYVPRITARARYRSSGKLLMMQASGGGDYWGIYEGVRAKVYFRAHATEGRDLRPHLVVDDLKMDFSVKDIRMGIENLHNGNSVLEAALNLFINTHSQDLLKEMKPDLKRKLMALMRSFMENLFARIPYDAWITE